MHINNESRWLDVNCDGESTGAKYHGRFCIKPYITLDERAEAERLAEKWMHGLPENSIMRTIMATLATFKFHLLEVNADWWIEDGKKLYDETPIAELVKLLGDIQRPKPQEDAKAEVPKPAG